MKKIVTEDKFGFPKETLNEASITFKNSHKHKKALEVLENLSDEQLEDQDFVVDLLKRKNLSEPAEDISKMSKDEYEDFIVNNLGESDDSDKGEAVAEDKSTAQMSDEELLELLIASKALERLHKGKGGLEQHLAHSKEKTEEYKKEILKRMKSK